MTVAEKHLTDAERVEWEKLQETTAAMNATTGERGRALVASLVLRDRNGEAWAGWILIELAEDAATKRLNKWNKDRNTMLVGYHGEQVTKPGVGSVKTSAGHQQKLFTAMTRPEIKAKRNEADLFAKSNQANVALFDRLDALFDRVPTAGTVGEALTTLGVSIDDYLSEVA